MERYLAALAKVDQDHWYTPEEAVALVKETHFVNFDSTIEVHMRLGVDPRHADQQVRDVVVLPHGFGKIGACTRLCARRWCCPRPRSGCRLRGG